MKFLYEYRTSENVRHEGVISATDREAAFAALKAQGIRPGRVVEAPGFWNKLLGKGKRWIVIGILAIAVGILAVVPVQQGDDLLTASFDDTTRRQILGDAEFVAMGIANGWREVFPEEGEQFFASFAVPGVPAGRRNSTVERLEEAIRRKVEVTKSDRIEARQIKSIVEGMKEEARQFVAAGGSLKQYANLLVQRQEQEISYYMKAQAELANAKKAGRPQAEIVELMRKRNEQLRKMGVRLVLLPM